MLAFAPLKRLALLTIYLSLVSANTPSPSATTSISTSTSTTHPSTTSVQTTTAAAEQVERAGVTTTAVSTAALPSITAARDDSIFTLSSDFDITDTPTTRDFYWNITAAAGAPDGSYRQMYVVNNQFPGPLIEANTGDTVNIHVTNYLDDGQSIHWHGMTQNGTAYMDGVPGITQCPIPYGQTFTYSYTINDQYGTYWWHSHYGNTLGDGLYGPLIVHSPDEPLVRGVDYDEDRVLMVSDWMHDQSSIIVDALRAGSYRGSPTPPQADAILVNGVGQANCSASSAGISCSTPGYAEIQVPVNQTIRFRIINPSSADYLRVSIDGHSLEVIEVDDTPVYGPSVHEIPVGPGQRYSFLVTTNAGSEGDAFWVRAVVGCQTVYQKGLATFRYVGNGTATTDEPTSDAWSDLATSSDDCLDLDQTESLVPRVAQSATDVASQTHIMDSQRGTFVDINGNSYDGFGFDNVSYQNQIYNPQLSIVESGGTINTTLVRSVSFETIGYGDILLNNLDGINHPFHLHGNPFQLLARGDGTISNETLSTVTYDITNPLRRDTIWVPGNTWILIRIATDNPGVWSLHCHIGYHLAEGKMATVVVQPEALESYEQPSAWSALCDGTDPSAFGPAKRASSAHQRSRMETVRQVRSRLVQRRGPRDV